MRKKNILLIFTDMQRFDTIAALGNKIIKTPNLDFLVKNGTVFNSTYSPCPVCIPARWCMHYGKYPTHSELYDNGEMPADDGCSLPAILSQNGYHTAAVGKCHFTPNHKDKRGFNFRIIQEECTSNIDEDDYCKYLYDKELSPNEPHGCRGEMYYIPQISEYSEMDHPSGFIGDRCVEYISNRVQEEQPYFLMASFIHPHPPLSLPKMWHKLYRSFEMPDAYVPENSEELYTWINYLQNRYKYQDQGVNNNLTKLQKAYYYGAISFVDYQIGKILDELKSNGTLDETLIIFSSDHGEHLGDYNCFGKRSMLDVSSRVPLIISGAGFEKGKIIETPTSLIDIMPTVLKAVESEVSFDLDGIALQEEFDSSRIVYSQFSQGATGIYMAVSKNWKYIYSAGDSKEWLFDRSKTKELDCLREYPKISDDMSQNMLKYLKERGKLEAVEDKGGVLSWRKYPLYNNSYLKNAQEKLLTQDHELNPFVKKGYQDIAKNYDLNPFV